MSASLSGFGDRRTAARDPLVSPWCHAVSVIAGADGANVKYFGQPGEPEAFQGVSTMLLGIDLHDMSAAMFEAARRQREGGDFSLGDVDIASARMVEPRP